MNQTQKIRFRTCLTAVAMLTAVFTSARAADPTVDGQTVNLGKQSLDMSAGALPAQITIAASPAELPLYARAKDAATPAVLAEIGRGEQLRAPVRLEAKVAGGTHTLEATGEPALAAGPPVKSTTTYAAEGLTAAVATTVDGTGAITLAITYSGDVEVESLELVLDILGRVDTVVAGNPTPDPTKTDASAYTVSPDEGTAWQGSSDISPLYVGSGDRGFTVITDTAAGWQVDAKQPIATIERDADGHASLRLKLVNAKRKLAGPATATLTLLVHPFRDKDAGHRLAAWKPWGDTPTVGTDRELTAAARTGEVDILAARAATVHEALAKRAALEGSSGGQATAADKPLTDVFPIRQFHYLAGTHTGLTAQLRASDPADYRAGANPGLDRMAIGRALLHDIGLDPYGLAHHTDAAVIVRALHEFGYFNADGNTEYIPYWRSADYVRYGEVFVAGGNFEVTKDDPMARVHTTVYLRPSPTTGRYRALIVVVNEGDTPVREQLYMLNPTRVFGKGNTLTGAEINADRDDSGIPTASDWRLGTLSGDTRSSEKGGPRSLPYLKDMEDDGYVRQAANEGGMEVYGPLHIPAHSYRILYGHGDAK